MSEGTSIRNAVWLSRLLRWMLGAIFITTGILYFKDGGWPAILFGTVFFVTGFFRPKRCIDGTCSLPENNMRYKENNT